MPDILVVLVNPKRLNVIPTDTRTCQSIRFSFVCYFENVTNFTNYISETEF